MPRIECLPIEQWDPELRALVSADDVSPLEQGPLRIMAHSPVITKPFVAFAMALATRSVLPRRLLELVRLRVAFHNQCRSCMAIRYRSAVEAGVTENLVCSLERPADAEDLLPAEKAAISYADLASTDHMAIGDETFNLLRRYFSEVQIVELGMYIAYCIGFGRLAASWKMVDELPEAYRESGGKAVAPWELASIVVRG